MIENTKQEIRGPSNGETTDRSVRRASVIGGVGLILLAVLAIFSVFVVLEELVTQGNATQTANDIMNSEGMFRLGIVSLFVVIVLDVVVAWALFIVFEPVNRNLSLLTAWFRVVYAGIFLVAASELVQVLNLLDNAEGFGGFSTEQIHVQALLGVNAFYDIWDAGYVLFGIHLILLGYLVYRSGYAPKALGALLVIAGLGYLLDTFGPIITSSNTVEVATFAFVGEVALIFWLLYRGRRIALEKAVISPAN